MKEEKSLEADNGERLCYIVIIRVTNIYGTLNMFRAQCQAFFNIRKYREHPETTENIPNPMWI